MTTESPTKLVYKRPEFLATTPTHYCPGCTHGVAHRLIAEVLDEMEVRERTIGVASVGCSVFAYNYFNCDFVEAAHGRAPAMATGVKRTLPDRVIFTYQGDGDLASIGMGEIVHAAARGENITVIFINNATYGMTGGQCSSTTPVEARVGSGFLNSLEKPLDIGQVAGTAGAGLVARVSTYDKDLTEADAPDDEFVYYPN